MMITSANRSAWHLDVSLEQWREAGLRKPCFARMKLFTLDNGLIHEHGGAPGGEGPAQGNRGVAGCNALRLASD